MEIVLGTGLVTVQTPLLPILAVLRAVWGRYVRNLRNFELSLNQPYDTRQSPPMRAGMGYQDAQAACQQQVGDS